MEARDLALYFSADAAAANQRFLNRPFRLRGTVDSFDPKMLRQRYDVILGTADRAMRVVCAFGYPEGTKAVFTKKGGRTLVRVSERGAEIPLLEAGQTVVVEGRCEGAADGEVRFRALRIVP